MMLFNTNLYYVLLLLLCSSSVITSSLPQNNPYLTSSTLFLQNYQKMFQNFKIFIYQPNTNTNTNQFYFETEQESLFYSSLQNSSYLTQQPQQAHLFFLPFSSNISTRSLARLVSRIRKEFPYWNRSLGADHFYLSCAGISNSNDRNIVELKKNAVQITCFPTRLHSFVPHKDITLPPVEKVHAPVKLGGGEFCVVEYGISEVLWIGEAMRVGCVPVVVTEGTMNDMPFMDVLKWREIAVFVKSGVKNVTWSARHENMRRLGVVAGKHLRWNQPSLPFDAFNTVMYQLWLRRHTSLIIAAAEKHEFLYLHSLDSPSHQHHRKLNLHGHLENVPHWTANNHVLVMRSFLTWSRVKSRIKTNFPELFELELYNTFNGVELYSIYSRVGSES